MSRQEMERMIEIISNMKVIKNPLEKARGKTREISKEQLHTRDVCETQSTEFILIRQC